MADITLDVQSFLNGATRLSITIDNALTVADLKTSINADEGTPTAIMDLYFEGNLLADATVLSTILSTADVIQTSNNLTEAGKWTKQERQVYKLELASLKRARDGNPRSTYDIDLLPNPYEGNTQTVDNGASTLTDGRPWTT